MTLEMQAKQLVRSLRFEGTVGWGYRDDADARLDALHNAALGAGVTLAVLVGDKRSLSLVLMTEDTRAMGHNQRINHRVALRILNDHAERVTFVGKGATR